ADRSCKQVGDGAADDQRQYQEQRSSRRSFPVTLGTVRPRQQNRVDVPGTGNELGQRSRTPQVRGFGTRAPWNVRFVPVQLARKVTRQVAAEKVAAIPVYDVDRDITGSRCFA